MAKRISELPIRIRKLAYQRQEEQGNARQFNGWLSTDHHMGNFEFSKTPEGIAFWKEINNGYYKVYDDRYGNPHLVDVAPDTKVVSDYGAPDARESPLLTTDGNRLVRIINHRDRWVSSGGFVLGLEYEVRGENADNYILRNREGAAYHIKKYSCEIVMKGSPHAGVEATPAEPKEIDIPFDVKDFVKRIDAYDVICEHGVIGAIYSVTDTDPTDPDEDGLVLELDGSEWVNPACYEKVPIRENNLEEGDLVKVCALDGYGEIEHHSLSIGDTCTITYYDSSDETVSIQEGCMSIPIVCFEPKAIRKFRYFDEGQTVRLDHEDQDTKEFGLFVGQKYVVNGLWGHKIEIAGNEYNSHLFNLWVDDDVGATKEPVTAADPEPAREVHPNHPFIGRTHVVGAVNAGKIKPGESYMIDYIDSPSKYDHFVKLEGIGGRYGVGLFKLPDGWNALSKEELEEEHSVEESMADHAASMKTSLEDIPTVKDIKGMYKDFINKSMDSYKASHRKTKVSRTVDVIKL